MNFPANRIREIPLSATVHIADMAAEMRRKGKSVLDFSAGRAAEHSPDAINQVAARALLAGDTHQTMAQGTPGFRQACAQKLARDNGLSLNPDKNLIATLGCKNGLTLALLSTIEPGDEVIVEDPCFVSYQATIHISGGKAVAVPLRREKRFRWTKQALEDAVTERTRCILFCSPQNPTGVVHTEGDLETIAEIARKRDLFVIVDEIYERLTFGGRKHICLASLPGMQTRTIGLRGCTKTFSMGGWRIGFAYAPKHVLAAMVKLQQHLMTGAGSFTQAGAAAAMSADYPAHVQKMWQDWEKRCLFAAEEINRIPKLSCEAPEGGFYTWINIEKTGASSTEFAERLLKEKQIALVPGAAFGPSGEGYVRMTCVKSWDELREGLARLRDGVLSK